VTIPASVKHVGDDVFDSTVRVTGGKVCCAKNKCVYYEGRTSCDGSSGLGVGAVVGIVIGSLVGVALLSAGVMMVMKRLGTGGRSKLRDADIVQMVEQNRQSKQGDDEERELSRASVL
jgi:hypothetical protein